MTFNELYLAARRSVRVTHTKRGEWHAYHQGAKVLCKGRGPETAKQRCAMLVAKQRIEAARGH